MISSVLRDVDSAIPVIWREAMNHLDLDLYKDYILAPVEEKPSGLRATFLGVSTLLFDDGEMLLTVFLQKQTHYAVSQLR